jgi:hypothetical protein
VGRTLSAMSDPGGSPSFADDDVARRAHEALLLVRVWLADRPGALGQVASRIGAMRGDIIGVDVLERAESVAIDEFAVALPGLDLVDLLVREIEEVDGASVEEWRAVERFPDPRLDALRCVERLCGATSPTDVFATLTADTCAEFNLDWAAVLVDHDIVVAAGDAPEPPMLRALAGGTTASPPVAAGEAGPADLAVAPMPSARAVLLAGRAGHPFRRRERRQISALARISERIVVLVGRG